MAQGQLSTLSDTSITPTRVISSVVSIIEPSDIPCLTKFGYGMDKRVKLVNGLNNKYEWLEGTLRAQTDQLNGAINSSVTAVVLDDSSKIRVGDVIEVDSEYMWISANVTGTNTLTVTRGYAGTTAASHSDNAVVTYLFSARLEGADSDPQPYNLPSAPYNYSQIIQAELRATGSELHASTRYGMTNLQEYRRLQLLGGYGGGDGKKGSAGELMLDLERTFFKGNRQLRTASVGGAMGGFESFVTTNVTDAAGASLDPKMLEDQMANCWQAGGNPKTIICNQWVRRKITSFYAGNVRTERREDVGGMVIDTVRTHFGDLDILMNRHCPASKLYIVQDEKVGWFVLRDWKEEELSKGGDYERKQIVGEFGFILCNEKAHAVIKNISTTS